MPPIGVLGGSFNPPHVGHLAVASDAWAQLGLSRVLFLPAADPPHKRLAGGLPADARLRMLQAAVAGDDRFEVCTLELDRRLRYTVDTLGALRALLPESPLWFIVGSDSLLALGSWREPRRVLSLCRLAVAPRPGDDEETVRAAAKEWGTAVRLLDSARLGVSSSDLRQRIATGRPIRYLVPAAVEEIITRKGYYL